MEIGKKIYYDVLTGEELVCTFERKHGFRETTVEEDIAAYKELSERNRDSFDVIQLEYGQYAQDFRECNGYRVNPETKTLEFSYPDPNETEPSEPVYQAPLSEEVEQLREDNNMLVLKVDALSDQNESLENVVQELIMTVIP